MTFAQALYSHYTSHPGLSALVGTRVYPLRVPQNPTLPAVTYQRSGGSNEDTHDQSTAHSPRIQFTCWAATYIEAEALALQVEAASRTWHDAQGGAAHPNEPIDMSDPETGVYQIVVDVEFEVAG